MAKTWLFKEFEVNTATVSTPTQTTDDEMGVVNSFSTKTSVGVSGVFKGSLQALSGQQQQDLHARFASVVDYIFFPTSTTTNVLTISNGDRLTVSGKNYSIIFVSDETGAGLSQELYLRRID